MDFNLNENPPSINNLIQLIQKMTPLFNNIDPFIDFMTTFVNKNQNLGTIAQPSTVVNQSSYELNQPSNDINQPLYDINQPSNNINLPSYEINQQPYEINQQPYKINQPSYENRQLPFENKQPLSKKKQLINSGRKNQPDCNKNLSYVNRTGINDNQKVNSLLRNQLLASPKVNVTRELTVAESTQCEWLKNENIVTKDNAFYKSMKINSPMNMDIDEANRNSQKTFPVVENRRSRHKQLYPKKLRIKPNVPDLASRLTTHTKQSRYYKDCRKLLFKTNSLNFTAAATSTVTNSIATEAIAVNRNTVGTVQQPAQIGYNPPLFLMDSLPDQSNIIYQNFDFPRPNMALPSYAFPAGPTTAIFDPDQPLDLSMHSRNKRY